MCMSGFTQYHPRPVKTDPTHRPAGAPVSTAEEDPNLYGPKPTPPEWQQEPVPVADHDHHVVDDAIVSIAGAKTQAAGGVIVELSSGTRLLICPV